MKKESYRASWRTIRRRWNFQRYVFQNHLRKQQLYCNAINEKIALFFILFQ